MKRIALALLLAVAAPTISFSLDVPTQYTLDERAVNKLKNATAKYQTSNDVQGLQAASGGAPAHRRGVRAL